MQSLLEPSEDYVSLTGTPGIGKSIFYLYFFQRFKNENPNTTIVTAAFAENRELEKCVVFEPGMAEGVEYEKIPKFEGSIHLYDRAPKIRPSDKKWFVSQLQIILGWMEWLKLKPIFACICQCGHYKNYER